jgi:hypothetical protein
MYHSDFALIVRVRVCACVFFSYDSANFTHTVHLELHVNDPYPSNVFPEQHSPMWLCDREGCVYF